MIKSNLVMQTLACCTSSKYFTDDKEQNTLCDITDCGVSKSITSAFEAIAGASKSKADWELINPLWTPTVWSNELESYTLQWKLVHNISYNLI